MAININCKKKWHPSRYETQKKVEDIARQNYKLEKQIIMNEEDYRRSVLKNDTERMSWMFE